MKTIATLLLALSICASAFTQISTLMNKNKLVIPQNPQEEIITITKNELKRVEFITSLLGEVQGYTVTFRFMWNGQKTVFVKKMDTNTLNENIKKYY